MDRTLRVTLDVCASFTALVTRRCFLLAICAAFFSQACQRENAAQPLEHGGSRSKAAASADAPVSNASNFNGTAISSGRPIWFTSVFKARGGPSAGTTIGGVPAEMYVATGR